MTTPGRQWWKEGVAYQVWPASYKDSNGDGLGDIQGVISTLDYLKDLGVDYMWLSPMYDSPQDDMGYDIRNYEEVDARYGTLEDMDALIKGLHDRGMRIILDLVVNHTSNQHRWFQQSAQSRDNEYSDYYIWRDPKIVDGQRQPPNNWGSIFGGSGWEYVESRDQYYLHLFLPSMPDLNWHNRTTRQAIYKSAIKFWLDRGVDGFRVDTVGLYCKNPEFPDAPVKDSTATYHFPAKADIMNGPQMHGWLQEQRREALDPYGDIVLVGELGYTEWEEIHKYINPVTREIDMAFDMDVVNPSGDFGKGEGGKTHNLVTMREGLEMPQKAISEHGFWSPVFLENHDQARSLPRWGSKKPEYRSQSGKLLAFLISTLSGTLFLYQGQEIGMSDIPRDWPLSELKDNWWLSYIAEEAKKHPGDEAAKQKAIEAFYIGGRDHSRTPIQWSSEKSYAGFSTVKPWMRVNENFAEGVNVAEQEKDHDSLLNYWKKCLAFRKSHATSLIYGATEFLDKENTKVLSYFKRYSEANSDQKMLFVLNFSDDVQPIPVPENLTVEDLGSPIFGTSLSKDVKNLAPWEGRLYQL